MNKRLSIILVIFGLLSLCLCDEWGCDKYNESTGWCAQCEDGYALINYQCVSCTRFNGDGCAACSELYTCDTCKDGYTLNDEGACVSGSESDEDSTEGEEVVDEDEDSNEDQDQDQDSSEIDEYGCITYGADGFCDVCGDAYILSNEQCVACSLYNGDACQACSDLYVCTSCDEGYYLNDNDSCEDENLSDDGDIDEWGCITYGVDGFCRLCGDAYVLSNYACVECSLFNGEQCLTCSDIYTCDSCAEGYVVNEDGACEAA